MKRIIPIVILAAMLLAACGENEPAVSDTTTPSPSAIPSPTATAAPTPTPTPSAEPTPEAVKNPLTGLAFDGDVDARPVAVMINNIKQALPQYGVGSADMVYEVVAEGGITRLVAVYQDVSEVGTIGSIRSTRPYYLDIAGGHDAVLIHAGGSEDAYRLIKERGMASVDNVRQGGNPGSTMYLDSDRRKQNGYEHSTMTTGERLANYLENTAYRTEHEEGYDPGLVFEEGYTPEGDAATSATVKFSSYKHAGLEYDPGSGVYFVGQYGKPHTDENTGEQLAFDNVIVLYTKISAIPGDTAGRMTVELTGGGDGSLLCGGVATEIKWEKEAWDAPFRYLDADGEVQTLRAGKTYVCVVSAPDRLEIGE